MLFRSYVAKIAKQSIVQVDRRMRNATQRKTGGVARRRPIESRTPAALIVDRWTVSLLPVPQSERPITERAGHTDPTTDLRRAAQHGAEPGRPRVWEKGVRQR